MSAKRVQQLKIKQVEVVMKEVKGNLWQFDTDVICITTNGYIKSNGEAVMGMGCAAQAKSLNPEIPRILAEAIRTNGNVVNILTNRQGKKVLVSYPVKPVGKMWTKEEDVVTHQRSKFKSGSYVHGWACVADINIIVESAKQLVAMADKEEWKRVLLPRMGCGAGELKWEVVRELVKDILDDRFTIITF